MTLIAQQRHISHTWDLICASARMEHAKDALPGGSIRLLGSSAKIVAGEAYGWKSAVLYMAPGGAGFRDGRTLCPWAGGCEELCLGRNSGRMIMTNVQRAQLWKTALYMGSRPEWRELLYSEASRIDRPGHAIRVDGTSDTGEGAWLQGKLNHAQCYDYTKSMARAMDNAIAREHDETRYHVTYSVSEKSELHQVDSLLWHGGNAAVVFNVRKGEPMPKTWRGHEVVNGDAHDLRFMDGDGKVAGLSFKAASGWRESVEAGIAAGFVQEA